MDYEVHACLSLLWLSASHVSNTAMWRPMHVHAYRHQADILTSIVSVLQESERKRHLLRLWLSPDDDRPLPGYCEPLASAILPLPSPQHPLRWRCPVYSKDASIAQVQNLHLLD